MSPKRTTYGNDVKAFFEKEHPNLVNALGKSSPFWKRVKDNSFSNQEIREFLEQDESLDNSGYTHDATKALQQGRIHGKIHNPG